MQSERDCHESLTCVQSFFHVKRNTHHPTSRNECGALHDEKSANPTEPEKEFPYAADEAIQEKEKSDGGT